MKQLKRKEREEVRELAQFSSSVTRLLEFDRRDVKPILAAVEDGRGPPR